MNKSCRLFKLLPKHMQILVEAPWCSAFLTFCWLRDLVSRAVLCTTAETGDNGLHRYSNAYCLFDVSVSICVWKRPVKIWGITFGTSSAVALVMPDMLTLQLCCTVSLFLLSLSLSFSHAHMQVMRSGEWQHARTIHTCTQILVFLSLWGH